MCDQHACVGNSEQQRQTMQRQNSQSEYTKLTVEADRGGDTNITCPLTPPSSTSSILQVMFLFLTLLLLSLTVPRTFLGQESYSLMNGSFYQPQVGVKTIISRWEFLQLPSECDGFSSHLWLVERPIPIYCFISFMTHMHKWCLRQQHKQDCQPYQWIANFYLRISDQMISQGTDEVPIMFHSIPLEKGHPMYI